MSTALMTDLAGRMTMWKLDINMGAVIAQIWFWFFVVCFIPTAGLLLAYWLDWEHLWTRRAGEPEPWQELPPEERQPPRAA